MKTVFALANGRSGTRFLCGLFHQNVANCVAKHEPDFCRSRPSMFARPVYDYCYGNHDRLRRLMERKKRGILSYKCAVYAETNHAFLKSFCDVAMECFPDMKLVHLVRDPIRTARSEANRELIILRYYLPLRFYRGDNGRRYFRWSLTGDEPIYQHFPAGELNLFQRYVVQWIEIENRAMAFLDRHHKHADCVTLHSPAELNDAGCVESMFRTLELEMKTDSVVLTAHRNRTPGMPTVVRDVEEGEFRDVVQALPLKYLEIFQRPPYTQWAWSEKLSR